MEEIKSRTIIELSGSIKNKIISDLQHLGIADGDILMVHSSFRSLGKYELNPEIIISAFLDTIGTNGTLLMPALSYEQEPIDIHSTSDTPSNVGALPEYFRLRNGTIRSVHPTHSVCGVGPAVKELFSEHQNDSTPCGQFSPFSKILNIEAKIVMLGCTLMPNTTMHAIEELIGPPYLFGDFREYKITTGGGEKYTKKYRTHGFKGYNQMYDRIKASCFPKELYSCGYVLDAKTYVINTKILKSAVLSKLKEDILFFVEPKSDN